MAAPKGQRIAIITIAAVMVIGTVGSFAAVVLGMQNESADNERAQVAIADYQAEVMAQTDELSKKHYPVLREYENTPAKFDRDGVEKLITKDLRVGDGDIISGETEYSAYYIGWNPDGTVFDQSFEGEALKQPIDPSLGLIEGWGEGVEGMKIGGVRLITIPSDKAYGEQGAGDDIPPNTPIKFIVYAIEKPKTIKQPDLPVSAGGLQEAF